MKRNSLRPKSLPEFSKSSSRLSIQRPKSLPGISKRPFSTPKPIKPLLIYSPAESKESTPAESKESTPAESKESTTAESTSSPLNSSAMRSPPPAAKIDVIHPIDLSQYDALLPQTHAYPLKIVAIYYIYLVYTIINSFSYNIENILQKINDTDYMQPELFKKEAIERLIALRENILKEQYKYKALDGSIIDIEDKCALIEMLVKKITIKTEYNVSKYLRVYLRVLKYDNEKIDNIVRKRCNEMYPIRDDDQLQSYIDSNIFTRNIRAKIIRWFDNISLEMINNKFKSQFKLIEELINILNDIWVDEKTKGGFIKYILKTQKTTGIQSGGMLSFLRSNRVLQEHQPPMNMRAKTGITHQIIKLYNSARTQSNRVLPEQVLHLNMYRRAHTVNFQNILDYISLIKSYLFEEDEEIIRIRYEKKLEKEIIRRNEKLEKEIIRRNEKLGKEITRRNEKLGKEITRYNKLLKSDYEKEYKHLKKIMTPVKDPFHKNNREWIRQYEKQVYEDNIKWIQLYERRHERKKVYEDNKELIQLYEKKQEQTELTVEEQEQLKKIYEEQEQLKNIYRDLEALKIKKELNNLEYEKIYKEKIDEEFKDFDEKPIKRKPYIDKKIEPIPTFSELNKEAEILIPLKLKEFEKLEFEKLEFKKLRFKKVEFKHVKFHIKCSIKYIKTRIDQVENDLSEILPIRINSLA